MRSSGKSLLLTFIVAAFCHSVQARNLSSQNTIFLAADTTLDSCVFPGFSSALLFHLGQNLPAAEWNVLRPPAADNTAANDSTAMVLVIRPRPQEGGATSLRATLVRFPLWKAGMPDTLQPLVDIAYTQLDTAAAALLVAKKIAENLRSRFTCRLMVNSIPQRAEAKSATGLSGICPAEWNVAFGIIDITAQKKGYLPKTVRLQLSGARNPDTVMISLVKRMPYHSAAFVPAIVSAAASAVLYGCEYYYYQKYRRLGENDLNNNPNAFGSTFTIAQSCEYGAGISLGLAGALFVFTLFW